MAREREQEFTTLARGRTVRAFVTEEHGKAIADLLPKDLSLAQYSRKVTDGDIETARKRLVLCATCPPHGGGCASEFEQLRGRAPCWSDSDGLHMDWCPKWPAYIVREKLALVGTPAVLLGARFETYVPKTPKQIDALTQCTEWTKNFRRTDSRSNLIIAGTETGIGKTHLAVSALAQLIVNRRVRHAMFTGVAEFFDRLRRSFSDDVDRDLVSRASKVDLLVLDDLAAQSTTDWVREQLYLIANARWGSGLPTIITTNAQGEEEEAALEATLGPRSSSRLFGGAFRADVNGEDQRSDG